MPPSTEKIPVASRGGPKRRKRGGGGRGRVRWLRWLLFLMLTGAVVGAASVAALFLVYASDPDLPRIDHVADYRPKVVTKILSADGQLIGELYEERRTVVPREKIPPVMIHALVDAEDAEFYQHGGLSYWGMLRAFLNDLRPGAHMQGASTLTQQLVRNLILKNYSRSGFSAIKRKIQEMILARRLEDKLSKDEILWLYLNQIDFPYHRFGVEEASRFYFGKSISDVDAGEAALLASLPKGPSEIDPWKHPERAKERQRYVLSQMVRYQHLKPAEAERFARAPIKLVRTPEPYIGTAPEFVDEVKRTLIERIGAKQLAIAGLTVVTTCDTRIQKLARDAVDKELQALDERHNYRKPLEHLTGRALAARLRKLARELPSGPKPGKIVEGIVTAVTATPESAAGATVNLGGKVGFLPLPATVDRYNPKALTADKRFRSGDVLRVRIAEQPPDKPPVLALELGPQAAAVVIDPATRQVKALVGGYDYRLGDFDRALKAERQPGSSFKPFLYATAFSTEKYTPATVMIDGPQVYASPGLKPWKPGNAEKNEYLGPVRLRVALAKSLNTVASELVDVQRGGVDPAQVVALAQSVGIESPLEANPSLALGTSAVTPIEMTNAYATFAAGGRRMTPQLIERIGTDPEPDPAKSATQAIKPELAYLMTSMLTSVFDEGTAVSARGKLKRPAAGKTGTTNGHRDAWFVGFTPDLVTGVWVGYDDMRELGRGEEGARAALPIWVDIMQGAEKGLPPKPFLQPPGVVVQRIDPKTGLLAPPGSPTAIDEVFLQGTAPTQTAPTAGEANPDTYIIDQAQ
ncbi:MAG TPA: PBP1A family penicillin-binding protein [Polyangia bacterium]